MSKTYTSRPVVGSSVRGRGGTHTSNRTASNRNSISNRGRGNMYSSPGRTPGAGRTTPAGRGTATGDPWNRTDDGAAAQADGTEPGRDRGERTQRRDAYTVIAPNTEKRNKMAEIGRKEEEQYRQHKDKQKLSHVSYVGTVGGGQLTESQARQRIQQQQSQSPFNSRMKAQQYRDDLKKREEAELAKKKAIQRQKAEANLQRDGGRSAHLREEQRRVNEPFLSRLEQQSRAARISRHVSTTPPHRTSDLEAGCLERGSNPQRTESHLQGTSREAGTSHSQSMAAKKTKVEMLEEEYPHYDSDVLANILLQVNGDLQQAKELIES